MTSTKVSTVADASAEQALPACKRCTSAGKVCKTDDTSQYRRCNECKRIKQKCVRPGSKTGRPKSSSSLVGKKVVKEVQATAASDKPSRSRGRPQKALPPVETSGATETAEETSAPPAARKRGRPPKATTVPAANVTEGADSKQKLKQQ